MRRLLHQMQASAVIPLALAVALGFALWHVAGGVSTFVGTLAGGFQPYNGWATWDIGGHVFTFDRLFSGLIEVAVLGLVAFLVLRRRRVGSDSVVG